MSWIADNNLTWYQKLACNVIKSGRIPRHVGVIMDGNRRYSKIRNESQARSYMRGFKKAGEIIRWCSVLGVSRITLYLFSLDNFKRSPEEIRTVMATIEHAFKLLQDDGSNQLSDENIRVKVIGDQSKIPSDSILECMKGAIRNTKHNKGMIVTTACPYTSTNEITAAARTIVKGVEDGKLELEDISEGLLGKCLYTEDGYPVDLLLRTSGEVRLSNFMMWQQSCSCLYFSPVTWPQLTLWDFLKAVFHYQRTYDILEKVRKMENDNLAENERVKKFLDELYAKRMDDWILPKSNGDDHD